MKTSYGYIIIFCEPSELDGIDFAQVTGLLPDNMTREEKEEYWYRMHMLVSPMDEEMNRLLAKARAMEDFSLHVHRHSQYTLLSHEQFGIYTVEDHAIKVSKATEKPVISISGFEGLSFQMSILKNGQRITRHQFGSILRDFGFKKEKGDATLIREYTPAAEKDIRAFLRTRDVSDAEDLFLDMFQAQGLRIPLD